MIQTKENNSSTLPLPAPNPEQAWQASILLQHGEQIWQRVVAYYAQLQALPRQTRRRLQRKLGTTLMGAALLLALAGPLAPSAHAATITVGGSCTLVEAIQNANDTTTGQPNTDCAAGNPSGADSIVLAGGTYNYTTLYASATALPTISSVITIEGNGATIARVLGSPDFRLLRVNSSGNLTLNNSTVTGGRTSIGGGISVNYGTLTLNNSTISNNEAPTGGGIYGRGSFTLNNVTITNNTATSGGGIATTGGTMIINDSTISNNTASSGSFGVGGGLDIGGATTINRTTISGNTAFLRGGGLEIDTGDALTLNNSTVSDNDATFGGGISNYGTMTLNNNTIVGNIATQPVTGAGGIFQYSGTMTLNRNIVAGNSAPVRVEIYRFGGTMNANNFNVLGHSGLTSAQAFSGFTPGANDRTATSNGTTPTALGSILNTTLADNGGPTLTHALVTGSPAIDIAPTGSAGVVDQRGAARDFDGNGTASANEADAGAVEFRQRLTVGNCAGPELAGVQEFPFSSGTVEVNVNTAAGLNCLTVEEMGTNHLMATGSIGNPGIHTGNWWHISGNVNSGFDVDITLPYGAANGASRVCQWPGNMGGFGWNCGPLDGTGTSYVADTSVTRSGLSGFSDWAAGDEVGPTAVSLSSFSATSPVGWFGWLVGLLGMGGMGTAVLRRRKR